MPARQTGGLLEVKMLLYHFTAAEYLEQIKVEGLTRGEVSTSPTETINAVWLTSNSNPTGHGLTDGHVLTAEERNLMERIGGQRVPDGARFPNKRAFRITMKIPSSDRALVSWPKWARKRLEKQWYEALSKSGGRKDGTWYLYFGTIPPDRFTKIDDLRG